MASDKAKHHFVSAVVLVIGLLFALILGVCDRFLPRPFGVGLWFIELITVLAIVPLRVVFTELGIRRSR
jgi:type IV secretory pathway TrbD component